MTSPDFLPFTRPSIDDDTIAGVADVLRSGWLTTGAKCREFEAALATYFGGRPVRVANSGTATLELALALCDIGPGDEVITTPLTWAATGNVIARRGARPVFVDVDPVTRNIDLQRAEDVISPVTRAVMPVDLGGLPVDRDALYDFANSYNLRVVEDAAQSMGSNWKGRRIGSFGDLVSFSFHANKNMTTGEGGCLVLNDDAEAARCERLRLQGVVRDADMGMEIEEISGKFNMTDIAARIGLGQLPSLDAFNTRRRDLARRYFASLDASLHLGLPVADFEQSNWHMFQVLLPLERLAISRGEFLRRMHAKGIGIGVHYPAMHLFSAYRRAGWKEGDCPNAERIGARTVTLPLFPAMQDGDVDRVCGVLRQVMRGAME
ncbi:MAG TPA: DegT/DnrJ/EryC1/StrS aminotransferase family protein [Rhodocyclaceae bacterium]|nr:DegT/DnrJ/EryC1/StrS aminotransferase family protein [Rhodocyclaceae bacterium]HMV52199.1 DegT/DnrJ/EryC1/StrS aminotransferase family protein [Rhodocyclaceae bacterium]HMZ84191.1 DegT/DnrJ/EryC1/StrS aminotransferase family protein [Rhodocyclaceae bacterium]HNA02575.1 DegT/DnrJ/EryC1/StrS aminotransferase family protein [Rhodocyclaceae bacterium]HNB77206.1 DegT/DnrJ/EryC1/StrS aminotransferase family protein [Rhodocyclaceae bacterium]